MRRWGLQIAVMALLLGVSGAAAETGTLWSVELESAPASACLLANGSYLAVGYAGGASLYRLADEGVARWSWSSDGAQDAVLLRGDSSDVYFFGLVIGADSALVQRWSTAHSDPLWSVELPDDLVPIGAAGFDVDRRGEFAAVLAADGDDNAVLLLIDQDGALQRFEPAGLTDPRAVRLSSGGGRAALRGSHVELVDLEAMASLGQVAAGTGNSLALSDDGAWLLWGDGDALVLYRYLAGELSLVWELALAATERAGLTVLARDGAYGAAALYDRDDPFALSVLFVRDAEPVAAGRIDLTPGAGRLDDGLSDLAASDEADLLLLATRGFEGAQSDHELLALERGESSALLRFDAAGSALSADISPGGIYGAAAGINGHSDEPGHGGWLAAYKVSEPPEPPYDDDSDYDDDLDDDHDNDADDESLFETCNCAIYCFDTCGGSSAEGCSCGDDDDDDIVTDDDDDDDIVNDDDDIVNDDDTEDDTEDDDDTDDDTGDDTDDDCGCGCSVLGAPGGAAFPWVALIGWLLLLRSEARGAASRRTTARRR